MKLFLSSVLLLLLLGRLTGGKELPSGKLRGQLTSPQDTGRELQACSLTQFTALTQATADATDSALQCSSNAMRVMDFVDSIAEILDDARTTQLRAVSVANAADRLSSNFGRVKIFASKIPRFGPILSQLDNIVDDVRRGAYNLGNKTTRILTTIEPPIDAANAALDAVASIAGGAHTLLNGAQTAFSGANTCSTGNNCLAADTLESFANGVNLDTIRTVEDAFDACNTVLGPIQLPTISISLPDLGFIDGLNAFIDEVNSWIMGVVEAVATGANHLLCCDNFFRSFRGVFEAIADLVNLATCWVDGIAEGLVSAGLNEILQPIDDILRSFDGFVMTVNNNLASLNGLQVSLPTSITVPSVDFDQATCQLSTTTFGLSVSPVQVFNLPTFPRIGSVAGESTFSFGQIGNAIQNSCNSAVQALASSDSVDCCDQARTCDPEDRIVLYEGNDCSQNVAGTLNFRDGQRYEHRTFDAVCTANDEARSVRIHGPAEAGWRLQGSDNPNRFVTDDYVSITLMQDIPEGRSICVRSFERNGNFWDSGFQYNIAYTRFNGLDGRVSRYAIDAAASQDWATFLNRGERFTPSFSEENGGVSDITSLGPITGLSCSGNSCDNKQLLKGYDSQCAPPPGNGLLTFLKPSIFQRTDLSLSAEFSEEQGPTHCPTGSYVAGLYCTGSRCDNLRLLCVHPNSNCNIWRHQWVDGTAYQGATRATVCPTGQVITGMNCLNGFCADIEIICSPLRRN